MEEIDCYSENLAIPYLSSRSEGRNKGGKEQLNLNDLILKYGVGGTGDLYN